MSSSEMERVASQLMNDAETLETSARRNEEHFNKALGALIVAINDFAQVAKSMGAIEERARAYRDVASYISRIADEMKTQSAKDEAEANVEANK